MISIEDRIDFYFGNFEYGKVPPPKKDPVKHDYPFCSNQNFRTLNLPYIQDVNRYLKYCFQPLWFQCGDSSYELNPYPVLVKTRDNDSINANGVISNLNSDRHWGICNQIINNFSSLPSWKNKKNEIVWRGVTTGLRHKNYNRENFVKDYFNKYDVGFVQIVQGASHLIDYLKQPIHPLNLLEYKYIAVIDGNDKASSLSWVLASNSVPIMPKPRFHSWLCEPWLEPSVHYVEVNNDFSDLEDKIEWCRSHDKECEEISKNGREFITQNFKNEQEVEQILIDRVINHVRD